MPLPEYTKDQDKAVQKILASSELKDKAFAIIFNLLNEEESTYCYEVRYNNKERVAMDYKAWAVNFENEPEVRANVYKFVHAILDQLMYELGESTVVVKRIMVMSDGTICD